MTDVERATEYLAQWRKAGSPDAPACQVVEREWRGQMLVSQLPVVGAVFEGCGAPLVPDSCWVQIVDDSKTYTVRVR